MMPLDSWIDDDAVAMLRALAPRKPETHAGEPGAFVADDIFNGFTVPVAVGPDPRVAPASATVVPPGTALPVDPSIPSPVADVPLIVRNDEPAPEAIARLRLTLAAIRRRAEQDGVVRVAPVSRAPAVPSPMDVDATEQDAAESPATIPPREVATIAAGNPVDADAPLAVRLAALCGWLNSRFGMAAAMVIDRHGCPLHGGATDARLAAAAFARGQAWRGDSTRRPHGATHAIHAAWGDAIMVVVPVPTRFGDLFVAGIVKEAVNPAEAAAIAGAVCDCAGIGI